jgi:hypothetical protein
MQEATTEDQLTFENLRESETTFEKGFRLGIRSRLVLFLYRGKPEVRKVATQSN